MTGGAFEDGFVADGLSVAVRPWNWIGKHGGTAQDNFRGFTEGACELVEDIVDGVPVVDAAAFVEMAAVEEDFDDDGAEAVLATMGVDGLELFFRQRSDGDQARFEAS